MQYLIIAIISVLVWTLILHAVVRHAIISAARQNRHEARIEQHLPNAVTWLNADARKLLEASKSRDA